MGEERLPSFPAAGWEGAWLLEEAPGEGDQRQKAHVGHWNPGTLSGFFPLNFVRSHDLHFFLKVRDFLVLCLFVC